MSFILLLINETLYRYFRDINASSDWNIPSIPFVSVHCLETDVFHVVCIQTASLQVIGGRPGFLLLETYDACRI